MAALFFALSALFSVGSGVASFRASRDEADAQRDQADIARAESAREADRIEKTRKAQRARSAMRFVKGGVTLQGSPLFLLETQEELDKKEVAAQRKRGVAIQKLGFKKAKITESRGRGALIGGIGQAAFSAARI